MASLLRPQVILIAYWIIVICLAAFFLRVSCTLCRTSQPTWKRAFVSVLVVTFLSYLVFDFTCYLIMRSMDGVLLQVPPWYSYGFWFREPIALKWYIVSHAGMLRFLPFIFALCAAGVLQLIVLQAEVTFRFGLLIVLMQWGATGVAAYVLGLVFGVALSSAGAMLPSQAKAPAADQARAEQPARSQQAQSKSRARRSASSQQARSNAKQGKAEPPPQEPAAKEKTEEPTDSKTEAAPDSLQLIEKEVEEATQAPREQLTEAARNFKAYADSNLQEMDKELAPLLKHLPEPVQHFLDNGGWWWILGICGFLALLWVRSILHRLREALRTPRKPKRRKQRAGARPPRLKENLGMVGAGFTDEGPDQIVVQGLPARLRLVILSPGSKGGGELSEEMADRVLDWIKPGLAEVAANDQPGVRVWPASYSFDGFALTLQANVPIPEPKGERSHWVVVAGDVHIGRAVVHVGLAFYAQERNSLRHVQVKRERWPKVLAIKQSRQLAAAR
jgi:hypothetical protein